MCMTAVRFYNYPENKQSQHFIARVMTFTPLHVSNLPQASQSDSVLIEGIPLDGLWKGGGALM